MSHGPWTEPASASVAVLEVLLRELDDVVTPPLLDVPERDPLELPLAPELPAGPDVAVPELVIPKVVELPPPVLVPTVLVDEWPADVARDVLGSRPGVGLSPHAKATRATTEMGSRRASGRRKVMVP